MINTSTRQLRRHAKVWLILAAVLAAAWLFVFSASKDKKRLGNTVNVQSVHDINLPSKIEGGWLNELKNEVMPVDFGTIVRDLRNYPKEFKDKTYFEKNRNRWTVRVMDVAEHQVIVDYLRGRQDRDKFAYFRYIDVNNVNNKERYLLTYGVMSPLQAMGAARTVDFNLPTSSRVIVEQIEYYLNKIDDYELKDEPEVVEKERPRVQLTETTQEVSPKPADTETTLEKPPIETPKSETQEKPASELAVPPTAQPMMPPNNE